MNYMAEYLLKKKRMKQEDTTPNDDMVPREKYREALDKANKFKNMWHNTHQELEGYKKYQSVPNDELRALVEEWRRQARNAKDANAEYAHWKAIEHKADELEELIDDE